MKCASNHSGDPAPPVVQLLDLATFHLSQQTMEWLSEASSARSHCTGISIAPYEYGAFVSVPENDDRIAELECPEDLKAVLVRARALNCDAIRFDSDGPGMAGLAHYDW